MTIFEKIQLGYYLCAALGLFFGIMITAAAFKLWDNLKDNDGEERIYE